jgi:hypothetical protein
MTSHALTRVGIVALSVAACARAPAEDRGSTSGAIDRPPNIRAELMLTDLSIVEDDPTRVTDPCDAVSHGQLQPWDFGNVFAHLAMNVGATDPVAFTEQLFSDLEIGYVVNGFTVPGLLGGFLDDWKYESGGDRQHIDVAIAPFRLLAIIPRPDQRTRDGAGNPMSAGEVRFAYGFTTLNREGCDGAGESTLIVECNVPATTNADVLDFATRVHRLGDLPFGSSAYLDAVQSITDRALATCLTSDGKGQVRTNIRGDFSWQMQEFRAGDGELVPSTVALTPDRGTFVNNPALADFINANEAQILAETHEVPLRLDGDVPFRGGAALNDLTGVVSDQNVWRAPGINNPEARHRFARNTCNGCHSNEANPVGNALQIGTRNQHSESPLSQFLTGVIGWPDPVTPGLTHDFHELDRRADFLGAQIDSGGTL